MCCWLQPQNFGFPVEGTVTVYFLSVVFQFKSFFEDKSKCSFVFLVVLSIPIFATVDFILSFFIGTSFSWYVCWVGLCLAPITEYPANCDFDKSLLISLPNKNSRGRQLLRKVEQLSNAVRLVLCSTSVVPTMLALVIVHIALHCKVAAALGIHVHIQNRKNGAARCHTSCEWPKNFLGNTFWRITLLKCHWPEWSHGHSEFMKEVGEGGDFSDS